MGHALTLILWKSLRGMKMTSTLDNEIWLGLERKSRSTVCCILLVLLAQRTVSLIVGKFECGVFRRATRCLQIMNRDGFVTLLQRFSITLRFAPGSPLITGLMQGMNENHRGNTLLQVLSNRTSHCHYCPPTPLFSNILRCYPHQYLQHDCARR